MLDAVVYIHLNGPSMQTTVADRVRKPYLGESPDGAIKGCLFHLVCIPDFSMQVESVDVASDPPFKRPDSIY